MRERGPTTTTEVQHGRIHRTIHRDLSKARSIIDSARADDRDLTAHEHREVDKHLKAAEAMKRDATVERQLVEMLGGGENDIPGIGPATKLSDLVRAAVPDFDRKALTDTPSVYVPSTFVAAPIGLKGRAGDGALWSAFPSSPRPAGACRTCARRWVRRPAPPPWRPAP